MKKMINKEEVFSCVSGAIGIAGTTSGYTLNYSVDGTKWTAMSKACAANENCIIASCPVGAMFKMVGNTDDNVLVLC